MRQSAAFQDLIDRLAEREPHTGYQYPSQIELTDTDIATVIDEEPDLIVDCLSSEVARKCVRLNLRSGPTSEIAFNLGITMLGCLTNEARKYVLHHVQEECQRREIERETRSPREVAADQAGLPAWGPL